MAKQNSVNYQNLHQNNKSVRIYNLGVTDYKTAWEFQSILQKHLILTKRGKETDLPKDMQAENYLIFCSHPPVYTLGKSGSMSNLLLDEEELSNKEIQFYEINRGGDITYHGPGQIVGYPIFNLDHFYHDVHLFVRNIEEVIISTLEHYGIQGSRIEKHTGVWIKSDDPAIPNRKICAIGIHLSRWVSMHGFAFNHNTDLNYFSNIIPCGINDPNMSVTSLEKELGQKINREEIISLMKTHFKEIFSLNYEKIINTLPDY
jgi:lipoyl(octanoyl) transferase